MTNQTRRTAVSCCFHNNLLCISNNMHLQHLLLFWFLLINVSFSLLSDFVLHIHSEYLSKPDRRVKEHDFCFSVCVCVCARLQPRPCARLISSAVELDAASGCHGDAMVRTTARIAAMKRAVRKLVRLWLNITHASVVVMATAQNSPPLLTNSLPNYKLISLAVPSLMERFHQHVDKQ